MSMTFAILATALSLASTNDYVYSEPYGILIEGQASFGSDMMLRGEDVAFPLEAFRERRAALHFVSTNGSRSGSQRYDASLISAARFNEIQNLKSRILGDSSSVCYVNGDAELPESVIVPDDVLRSFVAAIGGFVPSHEFDTTNISVGASLTNSNPARLISGLNRLTRVAFRTEVSGETNGFTTTSKWQWSGEPPDNFNEHTGVFTPGALEHDTQTVFTTNGYINPERYQLAIDSWNNKDQSWVGDFNDDGYVVWTENTSSSTGPMSRVFTDKLALNENYHAFCPGNAGMSSALVDSVVAYAICSYYRSINRSVTTERMAAVRLNAATDNEYRGMHLGYLPRIVITPMGPDELFDAVLEALGETRITTSSVEGRLTPPPEPGYPALLEPSLGEFTLTGNGSHIEEEQNVHVECLIVVIDYDFNAKTL